MALAASYAAKTGIGRLPIARRVTEIQTRTGCAGAFTAAQWRAIERRGLDPKLVASLQQKCGTAVPALGEALDDDQFVLVGPGSFSMGSARYSSEERPVRTVRITRPFRLQKTEVTQLQWEEVMGRNPSRFAACGPTCPVENVTWQEAEAFVQELNRRDPGKGYRLPTEAEWEYAARAGTTGDFGGTGQVSEMGWFDENSDKRTQAVAQKRPNAWGLYDMHGNVWEWVRDWWDPVAYTRVTDTDPAGPATGETRTLRGGSWRRGSLFARSASRSFASVFSNGDIGVRLARDP
jgi:formylglycine-generating enzyme required for sulfatase activity